MLYRTSTRINQMVYPLTKAQDSFSNIKVGKGILPTYQDITKTKKTLPVLCTYQYTKRKHSEQKIVYISTISYISTNTYQNRRTGTHRARRLPIELQLRTHLTRSAFAEAHLASDKMLDKLRSFFSVSLSGTRETVTLLHD